MLSRSSKTCCTLSQCGEVACLISVSGAFILLRYSCISYIGEKNTPWGNDHCFFIQVCWWDFEKGFRGNKFSVCCLFPYSNSYGDWGSRVKWHSETNVIQFMSPAWAKNSVPWPAGQLQSNFTISKFHRTWKKLEIVGFQKYRVIASNDSQTKEIGLTLK